MIVLLIFAVLGIGALLLILLAVLRRRASASSHLLQLRAVDVLAFRNLIDPTEEDYLRDLLPPAQFISLQRERMRAAADYVGATLYNSGVLLQVAQAAALSTDPVVAASAKQLIQLALRLRVLGALALGKIYLRILFPGAPLSVGAFVERYHHVNNLAGQLVRLQQLPQNDRVSVAH